MVGLPTVFVVDTDRPFIELSRATIESRGYAMQVVSAPEQLREFACSDTVGCIVSELRGPGWFGPHLATWVKQLEWELPVIIASSRGDVKSCAEAFRAGVFDFLVKPMSPHEFWNSVSNALQTCEAALQNRRQRLRLSQLMGKLTEREESVAKALVSGYSIKEIAGSLGTSFQSVARHRQRILLKLQVDSDVALANVFFELFRSGWNWSTEFDRQLAIVHD